MLAESSRESGCRSRLHPEHWIGMLASFSRRVRYPTPAV